MHDCLFCRMVRGETLTPKVYENDSSIVIRDINPQAPIHLLVISKKHYEGIHQIPASDTETLASLMQAVKATIEKENLEQQGYRLVVNFGEKAGQSVNHIHLHILSGRAMKWPPG